MKKILISVLSVAALGAAGYFSFDYFLDSKNNLNDTPENIIADYKDLLAEADQLQNSVGVNCGDKKETNKKIEALEKKLADLAKRKKQWLDNVPKLPEVEPEMLNGDNPLGRPGSEVPELSSDVPPLPDIDPEVIEVPGSQVPELTSDVPPLPEIGTESIEYIPDMPEINLGRPGSEVPELSSDAPPLPEINEINIIDPNELISQMEENEQNIKDVLQALKNLCQEEERSKKEISDKCSDACQRHKDCAAYTEDVTVADLNDAYNTCMEECATWPKEMIKCINAINIKTPNDCVGFVQCQLPQLYEDKYGR
jgi:predicted nuclease with TOPRIM domain